VIDGDGSVAYDNPVHEDRVISEQVAFQMVSMLEDVLDRGTEPGAQQLRRPIPAGEDRHDRRLQGCLVRRLHLVVVVGVWVGRISRRRLDATDTGRAMRCRSGASSSRRRRASAARASSPRRTACATNRSTGVALKPVEGCPTYEVS
jgi:membrane peptidoglycan carboxypeptidase